MAKPWLRSVFGGLVIFVAGFGVAQADPIRLVSGINWTVADAAGNPVGKAQRVCLNANSPASCRPGATLYGYGGSAWAADLSAISGAAWIWAPEITGATSSASLARYSFSEEFGLENLPLSASISIAADDFAEIFINGRSVGVIGSITDVGAAGIAQSSLRTFDISPFLRLGDNTVRVASQNGPDSFAGVNNASYSDNPAGVVFGITLRPSVVPEPATLALLASGLAGLIAVRCRRCRVRNVSEPSGDR